MATDEYDRYRAGKAEHYLRDVQRALNNEAKAKRRYYEALRSLGEPSGISYEGKDLPGSPNAYGDAIPDGIAEADEELRYALELHKECNAMKAECQRAFDAMDNPAYSNILELYYLRGSDTTWQQVASEVKRSDSWCRNNKTAALCDLYNTMPHRYRDPRHQAV